MKELISRVTNAWWKAGQSNTGLVFDPAGDVHLKRARELEKELIDRIAALEAERDELASELKKHCGCEFDPVTAECTVTCQTHKQVEDALAAAPQRERERLAQLADSVPGRERFGSLTADEILAGKLDAS